MHHHREVGAAGLTCPCQPIAQRAGTDAGTDLGKHAAGNAERHGTPPPATVPNVTSPWAGQVYTYMGTDTVQNGTIVAANVQQPAEACPAGRVAG
jgi:hypothetical protein